MSHLIGLNLSCEDKIDFRIIENEYELCLLFYYFEKQKENEKSKRKEEIA
jgi:hypothetical protein